MRVRRTLAKTSSKTSSPFIPGGTIRVSKCSLKLSIATSSNPVALTTSTGDVLRGRGGALGALAGALGALADVDSGALVGADNRYIC